MESKNKVNKNCFIHHKKCNMVCTYSKCKNKIICQNCIPDHLQIHPRQLIYNVEEIVEVHSYDKIDKMRKILGANKAMNQQKIRGIYSRFKNILNPLVRRIQVFENQSKNMITEQFSLYLAKNKSMIQNTKLNISDTKTVKNNPQKLIQQTIHVTDVIHQRQGIMKKNTQKYNWYSDATEQLCQSALQQLHSMISVGIKLLDNYTKIQASRYTDTQIGDEGHQQQSFYARYIHSHKVASKGEMNNLQMAVIESKKQIQSKDLQIRRANNQIRDKVKKIQELSGKVSGLKQELIQWEQKLEREEKQKQQAKGRQRKKNQQFLIKLGIIGGNNRTINLQKKNIEDKYLYLMMEIIPEPLSLNLSQHNLTKTQLSQLLKFQSLQVLKMNFTPYDPDFVKQALNNFRDLQTLELNSAGIDDESLQQLSSHFPPKLKNLHIIDNKITDEGLDMMFKNMVHFALESLYISYNNLSARSIQVIRNYAYDLKVLHISKNQIKSKGAIAIAKYLKQLQELYLGGTGVQKQGLLAICRNCPNLKRLNLVATELSTDIVSQILLGLPKLQWLDISYSNLTEGDLEKIEKLKIFNKNLEIVATLQNK